MRKWIDYVKKNYIKVCLTLIVIELGLIAFYLYDLYRLTSPKLWW